MESSKEEDLIRKLRDKLGTALSLCGDSADVPQIIQLNQVELQYLIQRAFQEG